MKLLLFALLPLAEAYINPNINQHISRSSNHSPSLLLLNNSNTACPGHCEDGWTHFSETDACYKNFFNANFNDAEYLCKMLGGHLASIHSRNENVFVAELAKMGKIWSDDHDLTWIGLREGPERGEWRWTDGTKLDFAPWASNSPAPKWKGEKRCALLSSDPYVDVTYPLKYQEWADTYRCFENFRSFVCKKVALH